MSKALALNHLGDVIADLERTYDHRSHGEFPRSCPACGLHGGECHKAGANCGKPAQHRIERAQDPSGDTPPRIVDRPAHGLDSQTDLFGEVLKLIRRPELAKAPER
jgi:hypothetical protein